MGISHGFDEEKKLFNVVIEIPIGSSVKYEMDGESGMIKVDRFLNVAMHYPCNYGYIPGTLGGDGDEVDVLVYGDEAIIPGAFMKCRALGVLMMEDEGGVDEKILVIPNKKSAPQYEHIESYKDLSDLYLERIKHFFERYKDLRSDKWVKVGEWKDASEAEDIIRKSIERVIVESIKSYTTK